MNQARWLDGRFDLVVELGFDFLLWLLVEAMFYTAEFALISLSNFAHSQAPESYDQLISFLLRISHYCLWVLITGGKITALAFFAVWMVKRLWRHISG